MEISLSSNLLSSSLNIDNRAITNWRKTINKVKKFSKGITVLGAVLMHEIHLIERYKFKLKINQNFLNIRLHPTKSFSQEFLQNYINMADQSISINDYVQQTIDRLLDKGDHDGVERFVNKFKQVDYLSENIIRSLTTSFGINGELILPDSTLADWTMKVESAKRKRVNHDDKLQLESFREYAEKANPQEGIPQLLPPNEYIFVLTTDKKFIIAYKALNIYHSSLVRGGTVLSAGKCDIIVVDGKNIITSIKAISGHYRPGLYEIINAFEYLEEQGINTDDLEFQYPNTNPKVCSGRQLKIEIQQLKQQLIEEISHIGLNDYQLIETGESPHKWEFAKLLAFTQNVRQKRKYPQVQPE